jgi:hypothetical protein
MINNKIKIGILASSLFLASAAYSQDTNVSANVQRQIEQNVSSLTNLAQNANGWRVRKNGDTMEYSTLQKEDFVLVKIKPFGLDMVGYAGSNKTIWDDMRGGFGLNPTNDAFEEHSRTNRIALYQNPAIENVARVNREYLSILERLNRDLDKSPRSKYGFFKRLFMREEE